MLKKRWIAAAVLCVAMTAAWSWAATVYQLQTKLSNAGGTLKVRNNATQSAVGITVFSNFTTSKPVSVTVAANPGYTIAAITKSGSRQTVSDPATFTTTFLKSSGSVQSLVASFSAIKSLVSSAATTNAGDLAGAVSPAVAQVSYNGSVTLTATPSITSGYVNAIAVDGIPYAGVSLPAAGPLSFTLTGVNTNRTVAVTFKNASVSAGSDVVGTINAPVTLRGNAPSIGNVVWTQVGGPATATITGDTSATASVSAPAAGSYRFQLASQLGGTTLATSTVGVTLVASTTDYERSSCNGCHSPNGADPSTAFNTWSTSRHKASSISCSVCHSGEGMPPTPQTTAANSCEACHSGSGPETAKFQASYHWNNHLEYGPEFTGGAVEGQLDANNSYTTKEDGTVVTCAYRCHFKPGLGPDPTKRSTGGLTYSEDGKTYNRPSGDSCLACHNQHNPKATYKETCLACHSGSKHGKVPREFFASKHWVNDLEYGPEFTGGAVEGQLDANNSYTTKEDGTVVTCAYRCHFKPGLGPDPTKRSTGGITYTDPQTSVVYNRPTGDACLACHDAHGLDATYKDTCLTCHSGSKHGKVPNEFFASKHWKSSLESGSEFSNQINTTVVGGSVVADGTVNGVLNANDSYTTTENGSVVTCAYRCHFRPGMYPADVTPPAAYVANKKATTYVMYSSPYGAGKFTRPGGDACMACHNPHGLEANARSTCYTCHAGGNHGWSVKAFEKSSHFTGTYAILDGMGGPTGEACTACHNAHSTEASFFAYSTVSTYNAPVKGAVGCQKCHTPGQSFGIYDANKVGKAPHFQLGTPDAGGYYTTASYITNNPAYSNACADCHSHNNTINKGWAEGGHGNVNAIPWTTTSGDNWNRGTNVNGRSVNYQLSAQKTDCQRCHTAKGFSQFWNSGFTNISTLGGTSSAPLVCSGCHASVEKGTLRPLPAGYATGVKTYVGYSSVAYSTKKSVTAMSFPDLKNSNICIPCHAGRGTGALIKEVFKTPSATPWMIGTRIYSHFAAAAGVVNGSNAYEFHTPAANTHAKIGLAANLGTGNATQGPCVGCHMNTTGKTHSLETIDFAAGTFKTNVCTNCHGAGFTVADVAAKKAQFNAALNVLRNLLLERGIDGLQSEINSRPGERVGQDMRGNATSQALIATLGLDQIAVAERNTGAAFNWWLFGKSNVDQGDVAAYVHNPAYASQVVMDSIDWLDDYQLNGSASTTIQGMVGQAQPTYSGVADGVVVDQTSATQAVAFADAPANHTASGTYKVQYVLSGSTGPAPITCTSCHTPGETQAQKEARLAWAESNHGETTGLAWLPASNHLWRSSGSTANFQTTIPASDCVRCHTTEGALQFATGATPYTKVSAVSSAADAATNSPLACNACHVSPLNATSERLAITAVSTFYNVSTVDKVTAKTVKSRVKANFPDVGESNMCISCHAGRVAGPNLADMAASENWDLSNTSFQNSHYMAAAGTMYMKAGFKNFTTLTAPAPSNTEGSAFASTKTYNQTLSPDSATTPDGVAGGQNSAHRRVGTPLLAGSEDYLPAGGTALTTNGPCVTCHLKAYEPAQGLGFQSNYTMQRPGAGHSLKIDEATAQQLCLPCHADAPHLDGGDGLGNGIYTSMKTLADMEHAMMEPQKTAVQNGLNLIKQVLQVKYQIKYDPAAYPYFYDLQKDPLGKTAITDWTRKNVAGVSDADVLALGTANVTAIPSGGLTKVQAYRLMGACFNLNVLARDPGAYLHARTYTQRLVYDTIDYLDNNQMDFTPLTTARVLNPTVFSGNECNVKIASPPGGLATESMAWLAGTHYSDTKGTTPVPLKLRP